MNAYIVAFFLLMVLRLPTSTHGGTRFPYTTLLRSLEAQQYGIAFPKGSDELRDKVNGALKTLRENGTYNEIYKKWFGTEPK